MLTTAKYIWLDLETSGLDPDAEVILEVAAIVTDADLDELDRFKSVLTVNEKDRGRLEQRLADNGILGMHTSNGLVEACVSGGLRIDAIDGRLAALAERFAWEHGKPILAGSSIHFDHSFVTRDLPDFAERLHHRLRCISALKLAFEDALGEPFPSGTGNHRAMSDIESSLATARRYQDRIRGLGR